MRAALTLLCRLPASGKTTYARKLEKAGAIRLSSDDWMVPLYGQHLPREDFDARLKVVRQLQWEVAAKLLTAELDVVLDEGFWRRTERDEYRAKAEALGAAVELVYFDVPTDELRRRLAQRNQHLTAKSVSAATHSVRISSPKLGDGVAVRMKHLK